MLNRLSHIGRWTSLLLLVVFLARTPLVRGAEPTVASQANGERAEQVWSNFRSAYPFSIQTVAVQTDAASGHHTVIVSEPPPHVTESDLRVLLPNVAFKKHKIGHDGFVVDAVASVDARPEALQELLAELHRLLFFTAYKSQSLELPAQPMLKQQRPALDFKIAADDVSNWLMGRGDLPALSWVPLIGGETVKFATIREAESQLYYSEPSGLIGWWIPASVQVSDCGVSARQFALDGDLILGAIGDKRGVMVIARQRAVPLNILPPLRTETICLLATLASQTEELMQTINPQLLSCFVRFPLDAGGHQRERWELNLLSPQLYDSEYGLLLTVSDVLLKSWSNNGLNSVRGFRHYPTPGKWAFNEPLPLLLKAKSLVYNYNAEAAGRVADLPGGSRAYSVVRTGVLPISYFPDEKADGDDGGDDGNDGVLGKFGGVARAIAPPKPVTDAEQAAYEWFARVQDPHLVRVVQYTALAQIFKAFGVKSESDQVRSSDVVHDAWQQVVHELVVAPRDAGQDGLAALIERAGQSEQFAEDRESFKEYEKTDEYKQLSAEEREQLKDIFFAPKGLLSALAKWDDATLDRLAERLANNARLRDERGKIVIEGLRALASGERLDEKLSSKLASASTGWIHSPVLIFDLNVDAMANFIGGHNIPLENPKLKIDPNATKGKVTLSEVDGSFRVHPEDLRSVKVNGRGKAPDIGPPPPPRPMQATLGFPGGTPPPRPPRSWRTAANGDFPEGFFVMMADVRTKRQNAVGVARAADGSFLIDTGRAKYTARTHREAIDVIIDTAPGKLVDVQLTGMTADQAEAFSLTLFARRTSGNRVITATVPHAANPALPLNFKPRQLNVNGIKMDVFEVTESVGRAEMKIPATAATEPAAKVEVLFKATNPANRAALKNAEKPLMTAVQQALPKSDNATEFHRAFDRAFKDELEATFGRKFPDLKVRTRVYLQTTDQVISEGPEHGTDKHATMG